MSIRELRSERLRLRPLGVGDVESLHSLWIDEPVRRFLWDGEVIPLERTREIVEKNQTLFDVRGLGIWGVRESGSDALVGFAGYWHFRAPPSLELLFGIASSQWNRGIATEAGRSVIRYGFDTLDFQTVVASTDVANAASIRVLEKLGMKRTRREVIEGLDTVFYELNCGDAGVE